MTASSTDKEAARLLAAIYPTRYERAIGFIVKMCFFAAPNERGPGEWLGEKFDEHLSRHRRKRADRGREMAGVRNG